MGTRASGSGAFGRLIEGLGAVGRPFAPRGKACSTGATLAPISAAIMPASALVSATGSSAAT